MSIRFKLLLLCLTTLVLPWAGCQYAGELETVLRASQEQALLASAGTIANALSAQPQRLFRGSQTASAFDPAKGDIYAFPLRSQPALDGYYRDDWGIGQEPKPLPTKDGLQARLQAGVTDRYLFLYLEVDDPKFDAEPPDPNPQANNFDRIDLGVEHPDGNLEVYFFSTQAPGLIAARTAWRDAAGYEHVDFEPRIQAYWLQTARGYHLEARLPLTLVGAHLGVQAIDGRRGKARSAGTMSFAKSRSGGQILFASAGLNELLSTFVRAGTRATVLDTNALKLGVSGSLKDAGKHPDDEPGQNLYRRLIGTNAKNLALHADTPDRVDGPEIRAALNGQPLAAWFRMPRGDELLLAAASPIIVDGDPVGAVLLEQAGEQLQGLRDRALARLFNLTLLATAIAVAFVSGFATWLSMRVARLASAADSAAVGNGRLQLELPEAASRDELGDLSRSFGRLLGRLDEYAQYLRTLGGKLSHELRTPLTIVRSSLDNLESEGVREDQRPYLKRAREGAERLGSILGAIGAASRVEESIKQAERIDFDLRDLMTSTIAAYRDSFKSRRIELHVSAEAFPMRGAPDLIVQMLDKLVENAVDFCPEHGRINFELRRETDGYLVTVDNDGPPIPAQVLEHLFESLFEFRQDRDDKPHFGLGLYIVRLIAEFHQGEARAENRADGSGVIFRVRLDS